MSPLILTGMHRSGTSAVARLVQSMGFHVGSNLLAATENNRHGHFEEAGFIHFHDQLISRFFPDRAPFCEWLPLADAETIYTEADRAAAQALWEGHLASGNSAWKDPRTSLFLDLWLDVLPEAKAIIACGIPIRCTCRCCGAASRSCMLTTAGASAAGPSIMSASAACWPTIRLIASWRWMSRRRFANPRNWRKSWRGS